MIKLDFPSLRNISIFLILLIVNLDCVQYLSDIGYQPWSFLSQWFDLVFNSSATSYSTEKYSLNHCKTCVLDRPFFKCFSLHNFPHPTRKVKQGRLTWKICFLHEHCTGPETRDSIVKFAGSGKTEGQKTKPMWWSLQAWECNRNTFRRKMSQ